VATTEALFDTLHLVSQTDYQSLEPLIVTQHPFFSNALTSIPIKETIAGSEICMVHRTAASLTPAAQQIFTMLASHFRLVGKQR